MYFTGWLRGLKKSVSAHSKNFVNASCKVQTDLKCHLPLHIYKNKLGSGNWVTPIRLLYIYASVSSESTQSSLEASTPGDLTQGRHRAGVPVRKDELPGEHNWLFEESSPAHPNNNSFGGPLNKRRWAYHMITSAAGRAAKQITLMPHSRFPLTAFHAQIELPLQICFLAPVRDRNAHRKESD